MKRDRKRCRPDLLTRQETPPAGGSCEFERFRIKGNGIKLTAILECGDWSLLLPAPWRGDLSPLLQSSKTRDGGDKSPPGKSGDQSPPLYIRSPVFNLA
jgi:hypothetical protein